MPNRNPPRQTHPGASPCESGMRTDHVSGSPLRPILGWLSKFVPIGGDFGRGETSSPLLVPVGERIAVVGPLPGAIATYRRVAKTQPRPRLPGNEECPQFCPQFRNFRPSGKYRDAAHRSPLPFHAVSSCRLHADSAGQFTGNNLSGVVSMPQVINTNVASLNAQRNLTTSQGQLATALQRLSSGLRINSAKDDAAGLAIVNRFTTQIRGL